MQTIGWKRDSLGSLLADTIIADGSSWLRPRCPGCGKFLQEKPIEIIADFAGWHLGWRKHDCTYCQGIGSRLVLTRSTSHLEYQTHPVC